jgi:hypothetical protein
MLSHYSAFLFAASLGIYAIARMLAQRPSSVVISSWAVGQAAGVGLAVLLYRTHISKLGAVYPGQPLNRFADFYLKDWYFHPERDHLFRFFWKGTFGVFRFTFGQTAIGQLAALVFFAGIFLLIRHSPKNPPRARLAAVLLITPFILNWIVVVAGLYPYGRTRQCLFLAIFGLAGVSLALTRFVGNHATGAIALALTIVLFCHAFGTLQGRDMLPLAEQRHELMDKTMQFIRSEVSPSDLILTDRATSFQLAHYLCPQQSIAGTPIPQNGLSEFQCDNIHIASTGPNDGALTAEAIAALTSDGESRPGLPPANHIWIVQSGWASGLGEALRRQFSAYKDIEIHSFGRYIEIFQLPQPLLLPR